MRIINNPNLYKMLASFVMVATASALFNLLVEAPSHSTSSSQTKAKSTDNSKTQPLDLIISLSRRQLILYRGNNQIKTYPVAVGRSGWETPTGNFQVMTKLENPAWMNPFTGKSILGGQSDNPLGKYWIGFWTNGKTWIGFHGTPNPESVGKATSHGCIRMYNKDIQELFHQVSVGTSVTVMQ
ncbi:L,D-transpeptidase [Chlorogloeopsis sp. ULAP02]|uniref:L,D-transpeptidase n=1 Tax=Chlorogloeopsis sp. ULAP02 TaxID=3107926 RepID=UPI0031374006